MSIRARLTIAIAAVLMISIAVLGTVEVQTTRATLISQLDTQVRASALKTKDKSDTPPPDSNGSDYMDGNPAPNQDDPSDTDGAHKNDYARLVYNPDGTLASAPQYAGWNDDPLPLPKCPAIPSDELSNAIDNVITLSSADGSVRYRALIQEIGGGRYQAVAVPMTQVEDTLERLTRVVTLAGLAALTTAIGMCWWLIKRGLEPVDHMVATAGDIAGGNLGARVDTLSPNTELGRLGTALNEMMSRIESSHDAQAASEQKLRRFVADAAHELRTPLTSLRGYAELYRQGALTTSTSVDNAMGRIESEGARMARLVDDLLLLARMDQDRSLERTPVDLGELVSDAVTDFRVVAPDRGATVETSPNVRVIGDHMRLRQVVDNLLTNVRTHTPPQTNVHVTVTAERGRAVLRVHDSGPGIAPEDQQRIFERFWRADRARSRSRGGSGLGLAIVASLVDAHDGMVAIESAAGEGSTFTVSLPLAPAA